MNTNAATPLISIVIPARNAAGTLAQTLDSVLAQTEPNWEAIIVDDGSADATATIIAAYIGRDKRFSKLTGPGEGVANARNLGIAAARGKYLHFLDADDWNDPSFYETMLHSLRDGQAMVAYCGFRRVMPAGTSRPYMMPDLGRDPFEDFARGCPLAIHAILVERALVVRLGGFDIALGNCEDWDLWQRVSRLPGRWIFVDAALAYYRTGVVSLSRNLEWLLANSRTILHRTFNGDERLAGMPDARKDPPSVGGSAAHACAYNAFWSVAMAVGSGGSGKHGADMLQPFDQVGLESFAVARIIFEGLMVGSGSLPEQMAERWPQYGARVTEMIAWFGALWNNADAARAIQYHLEEMILYSEPFSVPRRFSLTQSLCVDINNPPDTIPALGIDRLYVCLAKGGTTRRFISVAALGRFTKRQWLEVAGLFIAVGYRAWRKTRPGADWRLLRHAALLRKPGAKFRARLHVVKRSAIAALAAEPDPPGSHAARLAEIKAWAGPQEVAAPAQPKSPTDDRADSEEITDPADRQAHFERFFEKTEDPWGYGSAYEQEKYQRQLAMVPDGPIGRAMELACAEGHFTVQLAPRVGHLLATDIAGSALARTQARCLAHTNIEYAVLDYSVGPIPGGMDLIICSETLYYLADEAELRKVAPGLVAALAPGGCLVMAHAHAVKDDMSRTGFDWGSIYGVGVINRVFAELPGLALERSLDTELYRIDRFRKIAADATPAAPVIETAPVAELEPEIARAVLWGGARILRSEAKLREQRAQVPVLMYHSVSETAPARLARYCVSPDLFRAQMHWLRANGFYAIGSQEFLDQKTPFAGRPVLITFDDGLQNFADNAWPILVAHDFTAEMFVVTDHVGQTAIWDADKGEPGRLMDAATISCLAGEGALFGSHLATHTPIDGLTAEALAMELAGSHAMLAQWLGRPPVSFAAPFSIEDSRLGWMARQCGYRIGFSGAGDAAWLDMDPFALPRIEVRGDRPLEDFVVRMEALL